MKNIVIPELGEGIDKVTVAGWHVEAGVQVQEDDDILDIVTDKAIFTIQADTAGIIKEILFQEGQEARVGETVAIIEGL